MCTYVVLLRFTEQGVSNVKESISRAETFQVTVEKAGGKIEAQYWTTGPYDGVCVLSAPDDETAAALVLKLSQSRSVSTCMLRTFTKDGFKNVIGKMS